MKATAEAAIDDFRARYGDGPGQPVAVLIAAFNEEPTVAEVVKAVPGVLAGLDTEVIVVDDGSTDATASEAEAAGALVCRFEENLGQGAALQAGYRLAAERKARFVATLDADGQFIPAELERLVAPLEAGQADFVNGSRRLGQAQWTDPLRRAGLYFFGALISLLTGTRITDPANGMRAFRIEVPECVPLVQPQYQTSELLVGALARGFKVTEVPVTVLARRAGASKKGTNVKYAWNFARALIETWWGQRSAAGTASLTARRGGYRRRL